MPAELHLDPQLLKAAVEVGETAAGIKAISTTLREAELCAAGFVHLSGELRDVLCGFLDDAAAVLDELSIAAGLDAETPEEEAEE